MNPVTSPLRRLSAVLVLFGATATRPLKATQIAWDISLKTACVLSNGQPWPDMMVLELGSFAAGFNPTPANMASWAANWTAIQRASWNAGTSARFYSQELTFTTNPAPFTAGASAWIWGIKGNEWILFRKINWNWPTASPFPFGTSGWTADSSVSVVVGSVVPTVPVENGPNFFLRTAAVAATPQPLCYEDWKKMAFPDLDDQDALAVSGPLADPDRDGQSNMVEYLSATRPTRANPKAGLQTPEIYVSGGQRYLSARLQFDPRCCVTFSGQHSTDLVNWTDFNPLVVGTGSGMRLFTSGALQLSSGPRRHLRFKLTPTP